MILGKGWGLSSMINCYEFLRKRVICGKCDWGKGDFGEG